MLILSRSVRDSTVQASLSRRKDANSQLMIGVPLALNKSIKKEGC